MKSVTPAEAARLVEAGATLVDIRDRDEHLRERIAGALNCPLDALEATALGDGPIVFHCRSGNRTTMHAERLRAKAGGGEAYVVAGGIDGWRGAGLPTRKDRGQPIELNRQVQIGAGSLVLIGILLGMFATPWAFGLALFVGAGLLFAGLTGFCGLARLLIRAPWNRALRAG